MTKTAYRRLTPADRQRAAVVAQTAFSEGCTAVDVCRRLGVSYSTLRHICRQHQIDVPHVRRARTAP